MAFLTQTNFPRLWLIFQRLIGGTKDKQRIAISACKEGQKILEIGCSVGNIADAFRSLKNISYTGIDIDANAIALAQKRFADPQFNFLTISVEEHAQTGVQYDYILVAGMLHHVDDEIALSILKSTHLLAKPDAIINIFDPIAITATDPLHMRLFSKLERGQYLRSKIEIEKLIEAAGLKLAEYRSVPIRPGLPGMPVVAKFSCFMTFWQK